MKKIVLMYLGIIVFMVSVSACAQQDSVKSFTVNELRKEMKANPDLVVLDVRTPEELKGPLGHIDGVINIPVQSLDKRVDELKKYKDKEIAVICRTGHRSHIGTEILLKHGYNAVNVKGGMTEFRKSEQTNKEE